MNSKQPAIARNALPFSLLAAHLQYCQTIRPLPHRHPAHFLSCFPSFHFPFLVSYFLSWFPGFLPSTFLTLQFFIKSISLFLNRELPRNSPAYIYDPEMVFFFFYCWYYHRCAKCYSNSRPLTGDQATLHGLLHFRFSLPTNGSL